MPEGGELPILASKECLTNRNEETNKASVQEIYRKPAFHVKEDIAVNPAKCGGYVSFLGTEAEKLAGNDLTFSIARLPSYRTDTEVDRYRENGGLSNGSITSQKDTNKDGDANSKPEEHCCSPYKDASVPCRKQLALRRKTATSKLVSDERKTTSTTPLFEASLQQYSDVDEEINTNDAIEACNTASYSKSQKRVLNTPRTPQEDCIDPCEQYSSKQTTKHSRSMERPLRFRVQNRVFGFDEDKNDDERLKPRTVDKLRKETNRRTPVDQNEANGKKSDPKRRKRKRPTDEEVPSAEKTVTPIELAMDRVFKYQGITESHPNIVKVERESTDLLQRMLKAHDQDLQDYCLNRPAIAKYRMIREVEQMVTRKYHRTFLFAHNFLNVAKMWLEPYPDGVMPNLLVRTSLLQILQNMPIDERLKGYILKSEGIGHILNYLSKKDDYVPNRNIAEKLLQSWYRKFTADGDDGDVFSESFASVSRMEARKGLIQQTEAKKKRNRMKPVNEGRFAIAPQHSCMIYNNAPHDAVTHEEICGLTTRTENKKERTKSAGKSVCTGIRRLQRSSARFRGVKSPFANKHKGPRAV